MKIIAACDLNKTIGNNGKIPWYCSEDLRFFQQMTLNKQVIMGRKTWESLPNKPLPKRQNIVLTSSPDTIIGKKVKTYSSFEDILKVAQEDAFIIGGSQVYRTALEFDCVDEIHLTVFPYAFKGDAKFPEITGNWYCHKSNLIDNYFRVILKKI